MKKLLFFFFAISLLWSCDTTKKYSAITLPETDYVDLDTLEVTADRLEGDDEADDSLPENYTLPTYNPSHTRVNDLLHTKLEVKFDWANEKVMGKATLTFKPYFYSTDSLILDAKGFEFHKITMEGSSQPLKYEYDGQKVTIDLGKTYTRDQEYKVFIDYSATPKESGGSEAITSDKGLFFINPRNEEAGKPQQIWTQGETENNSRWFPTIDKPNERATNEIYVTVEDRFKTLSNGVMVSSKKNSDGTRTDYWNMNLPHAPYLVMLAIGEYAVVSDKWNGKPVDYYVEPKFEKYARNIFPHTPEMLQFFSDRLGVPYPWQKYSQVVVRDYVSGAMENTTAVIFGEFMNGTDRDLVDNLQNENIVAHEMFHHWFGDYVTCESWSNLTLNEGFANYSEYLWLEHKHGKDEADFHRLTELNGYLQSAQGGVHPLIHFGYDDKEDMFDAHSYNKGGLILHMLRNYVGDDAFFTALNKYLKDNAFTDVEADELRMVFEDVTGEDLNWFFNQWFFNQGHPDLKVETDYDEESKQIVINVEQRQDPKEMPPIFEMPVNIDIFANGKVERRTIRLTERSQTFTLDFPTDPDLVIFDGDGTLLATKEEDKSVDEYIFQFEHAKNLKHRIEALGELNESEDPRAKTLFEKALGDKFWLMRLFAINSVDLNGETEARILAIAEKDPNSNVRESAINKLAESEDKKYAPVAAKAVNDPAIKVVSAGLDALLVLDKEAALATAKKLENDDDEGIIVAIAQMYSEAGDPARLPYFEQKFDKVGGYAVFTFIQAYGVLAEKGTTADMLRTAEKLKSVAMNESKLFWLRFASTKSINAMHTALSEQMETESDPGKLKAIQEADAKLITTIKTIKDWEKDEKVIKMYEAFPDPAGKP